MQIYKEPSQLNNMKKEPNKKFTKYLKDIK